jgi:hypothetical protein
MLKQNPKEVVQDKKNEDVHADKDGGSDSLLNSSKKVVDIQNDLDNASNGGGSSNVFLWCQDPPSISDAGLDLLNNLLPQPLGLLISPEKMPWRIGISCKA